MEQELLEQLNRIEQNTLLASKRVLTLNDVVLLTGLTRGYLYKLTSSQQIPHYKPNGKLVYFDRAEVEAWMLQNKVQTQAEAEQQAIKYCLNHDARKGARV